MQVAAAEEAPAAPTECGDSLLNLLLLADSSLQDSNDEQIEQVEWYQEVDYTGQSKSESEEDNGDIGTILHGAELPGQRSMSTQPGHMSSERPTAAGIAKAWSHQAVRHLHQWLPLCLSKVQASLSAYDLHFHGVF